MDTGPPGSEKVGPSSDHHTYALFISAALRFSGSKHGCDLSADLVTVREQRLFHQNMFNVLSGQCILTVGTDNRPPTDRGFVNLLPAHCYAVMGPFTYAMH
jgi:hypothetical protein